MDERSRPEKVFYHSPNGMLRVGDIYRAFDAVITGAVKLDAGVNIWFGTVIRGDIADIRLMERVNVQDQCMLHTDFAAPLVLEPDVVVGHGVTVHGSRIGAGSLIGMGATLLSGSVIGEECLIAAGSLVTEDKVIPPRSVVMGVPGKVVRRITDEEVERTRVINARDRALAAQYADGELSWPYGTPITQ